MALIKCSECEKEYDVELLECPKCKKPLFTKDSYALLTPQEKGALRKLLWATDDTYKNRMLLGIGCCLVAIVLILFVNLFIGIIFLIPELYCLISAEKYEKKYYDEKIAKISKKSKKEITRINDESKKAEQLQKEQTKKKLIRWYIIIGVVGVLAIIIVNSILNKQTDADYDRMKRCWDKGMDYNYETGRCKTADEAYRDWLTDPYS